MTPLVAGWQFTQDDNLTDAAALSADGAGWTTVGLPHTWNARDAASIAQTTPASKDYKRAGWGGNGFSSRMRPGAAS